jgi:Flp pilus assembly protein TadB
MGAESDLPRSIRRGPKITIACECGEKRYLQYGERWTCEKCGRTWNTRRIPLEEYAALRRVQLRYRRIPLAVSLLALACVVVFILLGKAFGGLIVVAFAATAWSMFVRPMHKRRYREQLAKLPTWKIEPE